MISSRLKAWFIFPGLLLVMTALWGSLFLLWWQPALAAVGALMANAPLLLFMVWLMMARRARTSRYLPWVLGPSLLGALLSLLAFEGPQTDRLPWSPILGALGAIVSVLYVFWYSRLPRTLALQVGDTMPNVALQGLDGHWLHARDLLGTKVLWLFYRGNWCPLCMAQIHELAEAYAELEARGVRVLLISNQAQQETAPLAGRFGLKLAFLVDPDGQAAKALGILHAHGIPRGMDLKYGADTVLPTVILSDESGRVRWLEQTDNYRVRPEPAEFLARIDRLAAEQAAGAA